MKLRRRVEITIQRRELTLTQHCSHPNILEHCPACACEVNMLPVEVAAIASRVSPRVLYRWIEQDRVHYRELIDGTVLVCENSIPRK